MQSEACVGHYIIVYVHETVRKSGNFHSPFLAIKILIALATMNVVRDHLRKYFNMTDRHLGMLCSYNYYRHVRKEIMRPPW